MQAGKHIRRRHIRRANLTLNFANCRHRRFFGCIAVPALVGDILACCFPLLSILYFLLLLPPSSSSSCLENLSLWLFRREQPAF
jgi:hypothetical protein